MSRRPGRGGSRTGYLAATAAVAAAGIAVARALGWGEPGAVAAGVGTAWALQAPSFWRLAGAVARNDDATRDWLGGMALRLGGLALLAVAGGVTAWPARDLAVAYVASLLVFLLMEAVWIYRLQPAAGPGGGRAPAERGGRRERGRSGGGEAAAIDETQQAPEAGAPTTTEPPAR